MSKGIRTFFHPDFKSELSNFPPDIAVQIGTIIKCLQGGQKLLRQKFFPGVTGVIVFEEHGFSPKTTYEVFYGEIFVFGASALCFLHTRSICQKNKEIAQSNDVVVLLKKRLESAMSVQKAN